MSQPVIQLQVKTNLDLPLGIPGGWLFLWVAFSSYALPALPMVRVALETSSRTSSDRSWGERSPSELFSCKNNRIFSDVDGDGSWSISRFLSSKNNHFLWRRPIDNFLRPISFGIRDIFRFGPQTNAAFRWRLWYLYLTDRKYEAYMGRTKLLLPHTYRNEIWAIRNYVTDRGSLENFKFQGRRQRQTLPRWLWSTGELGKDVVVVVVVIVGGGGGQVGVELMVMVR